MDLQKNTRGLVLLERLLAMYLSLVIWFGSRPRAATTLSLLRENILLVSGFKWLPGNDLSPGWLLEQRRRSKSRRNALNTDFPSDHVEKERDSTVLSAFFLSLLVHPRGHGKGHFPTLIAFGDEDLNS